MSGGARGRLGRSEPDDVGQSMTAGIDGWAGGPAGDDGSPGVPVLDAHGHIGSWPDFLIPDPGPSGLVAMADRVGVAAIGVSDLLAVGADTLAGNERALAAAAAHPGRLGVWLVANPHHRSALAYLAGQLDHPAVWGIKLHPDVHECRLDDPAYDAVFALAAERRAPVLAHAQTGTVWSDPALFADVGRRHPDVPLLMGHAGLWREGFARAAQVAADVPSLYLETCGSRMTGGWVARLVSLAGAERVVFGSDSCFLDLRVGVGRIRLAPMTDDERAAVLGRNLQRILGPRGFRSRGRSDGARGCPEVGSQLPG